MLLLHHTRFIAYDPDLMEKLLSNLNSKSVFGAKFDAKP